VFVYVHVCVCVCVRACVCVCVCVSVASSIMSLCCITRATGARPAFSPHRTHLRPDAALHGVEREDIVAEVARARAVRRTRGHRLKLLLHGRARAPAEAQHHTAAVEQPARARTTEALGSEQSLANASIAHSRTSLTDGCAS